VTDFEEHNQMTPDALAIVFSPNLLRAPDNDFLVIMANMPHTNKLVKTLISNVRFSSLCSRIGPDSFTSAKLSLTPTTMQKLSKTRTKMRLQKV
jgi:hypothetical protein